MGENNQIRSIKDAVDLFSGETGLPLKFEEVPINNGKENVVAARLHNQDEIYGVMIMIFGEGNNAQACVYHGRYPKRDERAPITLDYEVEPSGIERRDTNPVDFIGVPPRDTSVLRPSRASAYLNRIPLPR